MLRRITHHPISRFLSSPFLFSYSAEQNRIYSPFLLILEEASFPPQLEKENEGEKEAQEQLRDDRGREDDHTNSWPSNQVIERPGAIEERNRVILCNICGLQKTVSLIQGCFYVRRLVTPNVTLGEQRKSLGTYESKFCVL